MRTHGWWERLNEYVLAHRDRARNYGTWDCWQFVGGAVLVMTGTDYRERFPRYNSLDEGLRILREAGGEEHFLTEFFGAKKPIAFAQRGDVVIADLGEGIAGCICIGVKSVTVGPDGLDYIDTRSGIAAWAV
jgi:hypothetical protein